MANWCRAAWSGADRHMRHSTSLRRRRRRPLRGACTAGVPAAGGTVGEPSGQPIDARANSALETAAQAGRGPPSPPLNGAELGGLEDSHERREEGRVVHEGRVAKMRAGRQGVWGHGPREDERQAAEERGWSHQSQQRRIMPRSQSGWSGGTAPLRFGQWKLQASPKCMLYILVEAL